MRTVKAAASVAAAAAVLLSLSACGPLGAVASAAGGNSAAQAVKALDVAQKRTSEVHTATVESTESFGGTVSMTMTGSYDWSHGVNAAMTVHVTGGQAASALRQRSVPDTEQVRFLPDAFFVRFDAPEVTSLMHGRHWLRYGWGDLPGAQGASSAYLRSLAENADPVQSVASVLASRDLRKAGVESVRGVTATHYAGTLDTARLADRLPGVSAAVRARLKQRLAAQGATAESVDLWVSKDGLPVKVVTRVTTKAGVMSSTVYYAHFGTAVRVTAPPASDTADFAEVARQATPATS
ncbi:LolA-like protein [Actinacidiphila rubida]|uniref:Lipoprotein n=1 Tax=Actinacidiphila rubida TaxID=310780 RepID=A0A1H8M789_9ACTN|nr:hypothetical protein [Actinacidiphila rubida]SEO13185.1 hypothetical protein SAMN05216267_101833 [Actinacidiphila rubida]